MSDTGMTNSAWEALNADIEAFRGDVIDETKAERFGVIRELAEELARTDASYKLRPTTFGKATRHGSVTLYCPSFSIIQDERVKKLLSELYATAETVIQNVGPNSIVLSFDVLDMWKEFHYEYGPGRTSETYVWGEDGNPVKKK